jgi:hypothetical protein
MQVTRKRAFITAFGVAWGLVTVAGIVICKAAAMLGAINSVNLGAELGNPAVWASGEVASYLITATALSAMVLAVTFWNRKTLITLQPSAILAIAAGPTVIWLVSAVVSLPLSAVRQRLETTPLFWLIAYTPTEFVLQSIAILVPTGLFLLAVTLLRVRTTV